jgi:hypothetical protein
VIPWLQDLLSHTRKLCRYVSEFNGNVRVVQWGDSWRSLDFNGISQGIAYVGAGINAEASAGAGVGSGAGAGAASAAASPEVMGSQYLRWGC